MNSVGYINGNDADGEHSMINNRYIPVVLATARDKEGLMKMDMFQNRLIAVIVATAVILRSFDSNSFVCTSYMARAKTRVLSSIELFKTRKE